MPGGPRTDPSRRDYRTGLLPQVMTAKRFSPPSVSRQAHVAASAGTVPGDWFACTDSPRPSPFPPSAPPQVASHPLCSPTSSVVWIGPTSCVRALASCSLRIHATDPTANAAGPDTGSPGFRVRSYPTCPGSPTAREPDAPCHCGTSDVAFHSSLVVLQGRNEGWARRRMEGWQDGKAE